MCLPAIHAYAGGIGKRHSGRTSAEPRRLRDAGIGLRNRIRCTGVSRGCRLTGACFRIARFPIAAHAPIANGNACAAGVVAHKTGRALDAFTRRQAAPRGVVAASRIAILGTEKTANALVGALSRKLACRRAGGCAHLPGIVANLVCRAKDTAAGKLARAVDFVANKREFAAPQGMGVCTVSFFLPHEENNQTSKPTQNRTKRMCPLWHANVKLQGKRSPDRRSSTRNKIRLGDGAGVGVAASKTRHSRVVTLQ